MSFFKHIGCKAIKLQFSFEFHDARPFISEEAVYLVARKKSTSDESARTAVSLSNTMRGTVSWGETVTLKSTLYTKKDDEKSLQPKPFVLLLRMDVKEKSSIFWEVAIDLAEFCATIPFQSTKHFQMKLNKNVDKTLREEATEATCGIEPTLRVTVSCKHVDLDAGAGSATATTTTTTATAAASGIAGTGASAMNGSAADTHRLSFLGGGRELHDNGSGNGGGAKSTSTTNDKESGSGSGHGREAIVGVVLPPNHNGESKEFPESPDHSKRVASAFSPSTQINRLMHSSDAEDGPAGLTRRSSQPRNAFDSSGDFEGDDEAGAGSSRPIRDMSSRGKGPDNEGSRTGGTFADKSKGNTNGGVSASVSSSGGGRASMTMPGLGDDRLARLGLLVDADLGLHGRDHDNDDESGNVARMNTLASPVHGNSMIHRQQLQRQASDGATDNDDDDVSGASLQRHEMRLADLDSGHPFTRAVAPSAKATAASLLLHDMVAPSTKPFTNVTVVSSNNNNNNNNNTLKVPGGGPGAAGGKINMMDRAKARRGKYQTFDAAAFTKAAAMNAEGTLPGGEGDDSTAGHDKHKRGGESGLPMFTRHGSMPESRATGWDHTSAATAAGASASAGGGGSGSNNTVNKVHIEVDNALIRRPGSRSPAPSTGSHSGSAAASGEGAGGGGSLPPPSPALSARTARAAAVAAAAAGQKVTDSGTEDNVAMITAAAPASSSLSWLASDYDLTGSDPEAGNLALRARLGRRTADAKDDSSLGTTSDALMMNRQVHAVTAGNAHNTGASVSGSVKPSEEQQSQQQSTTTITQAAQEAKPEKKSGVSAVMARLMGKHYATLPSKVFKLGFGGSSTAAAEKDSISATGAKEAMPTASTPAPSASSSPAPSVTPASPEDIPIAPFLRCQAALGLVSLDTSLASSSLAPGRISPSTYTSPATAGAFQPGGLRPTTVESLVALIIDAAMANGITEDPDDQDAFSLSGSFALTSLSHQPQPQHLHQHQQSGATGKSTGHSIHSTPPPSSFATGSRHGGAAPSPMTPNSPRLMPTGASGAMRSRNLSTHLRTSLSLHSHGSLLPPPPAILYRSPLEEWSAARVDPLLPHTMSPPVVLFRCLLHWRAFTHSQVWVLTHILRAYAAALAELGCFPKPTFPTSLAATAFSSSSSSPSAPDGAITSTGAMRSSVTLQKQSSLLNDMNQQGGNMSSSSPHATEAVSSMFQATYLPLLASGEGSSPTMCHRAADTVSVLGQILTLVHLSHQLALLILAPHSTRRRSRSRSKSERADKEKGKETYENKSAVGSSLPPTSSVGPRRPSIVTDSPHLSLSSLWPLAKLALFNPDAPPAASHVSPSTLVSSATLTVPSASGVGGSASSSSASASSFGGTTTTVTTLSATSAVEPGSVLAWFVEQLRILSASLVRHLVQGALTKVSRLPLMTLVHVAEGEDVTDAPTLDSVLRVLSSLVALFSVGPTPNGSPSVMGGSAAAPSMSDEQKDCAASFQNRASSSSSSASVSPLMENVRDAVVGCVVDEICCAVFNAVLRNKDLCSMATGMRLQVIVKGFTNWAHGLGSSSLESLCLTHLQPLQDLALFLLIDKSALTKDDLGAYPSLSAMQVHHVIKLCAANEENMDATPVALVNHLHAVIIRESNTGSSYSDLLFRVPPVVDGVDVLPGMIVPIVLEDGVVPSALDPHHAGGLPPSVDTAIDSKGNASTAGAAAGAVGGNTSSTMGAPRPSSSFLSPDVAGNVPCPWGAPRLTYFVKSQIAFLLKSDGIVL